MAAQQDSSTSGSALAGTLGEAGEFAVVRDVTARLSQPANIQLGPGDDAAVLGAPDGRVVVSCDMLVDGVHFKSEWASGEQIGQRAAIAAMADIFAMGAAPTALAVAFAAPADTPAASVTAIGAGIAQAAAQYGAGLVGGDLTSGPALTITVTVLGDLGGLTPVVRSGAGPGDTVALAGRVGWSAAGLAVLSRGFRSPAAVVGAYRVPEPPLGAGLAAAAAGATAMIDISDGLLADLGHIAMASGVAIDVESAALPVPDRLAEVASALGKDARDWLLTGGDDHALAAAFPQGSELPEPWRRIGTVAGGGARGEQVVTVDGAPYDGVTGWQHFR